MGNKTPEAWLHDTYSHYRSRRAAATTQEEVAVCNEVLGVLDNCYETCGIQKPVEQAASTPEKASKKR